METNLVLTTTWDSPSSTKTFFALLDVAFSISLSTSRHRSLFASFFSDEIIFSLKSIVKNVPYF